MTSYRRAFQTFLWWCALLIALFLPGYKVFDVKDQNYLDAVSTLVKKGKRQEAMEDGDNAAELLPQHFPSSNHIYGFLHMAKTAGTDINGKLAATYERVCGNKGMSYDYYAYNERFRQYVNQTKRHDVVAFGVQSKDQIHRLYGKYLHRGAFNFIHGMEEIGLEDCDYLALEDDATIWSEVAQTRNIELHVPCREPINHLMSNINFLKKDFYCGEMNTRTTSTLQVEIRKGGKFMNRFADNLEANPNITLKCFNPLPVEPYLQYMGVRLQRRRFVADYVRRETNVPRNITNECIWRDDQLKERVHQLMMQMYPYYRFCNACMGSQDELQLPSTE